MSWTIHHRRTFFSSLYSGCYEVVLKWIFSQIQLVGVHKQFVICVFITSFPHSTRFYVFMFLPSNLFSLLMPMLEMKICTIRWHDFEEYTRRQNENWNVLCIKAQFQMDYCSSKSFMPFHHPNACVSHLNSQLFSIDFLGDCVCWMAYGWE